MSIFHFSADLMIIGIMVSLELLPFFPLSLLQVSAAETETGKSAGMPPPMPPHRSCRNLLFPAFRKLPDKRGNKTAGEIVAASRGIAAK